MDLLSLTNIDFNQNNNALKIIRYSHYIPIEDISKPTFIPVIKCMHKVEKVIYSVNLVKITDRNRRLFEKSIKIYHKLKDPEKNIVQIREDLEIDDFKLIVLEFLEERLEDILLTNFNEGMPEVIAFFFFRQIFKGVKEIHKVNCIHRDLRLDQLFLKDYQVKISGFVYSYEIGLNEKIIKLFNNSIYNPPELFQSYIHCFKDKNATKVDVYSLGVILYLLIHNTYPIFYNDKSIKFKSKISKELKDLIVNCLETFVEDRYDMKDIENSNWFIMMNDKLSQLEKNKDLSHKQLYINILAL